MRAAPTDMAKMMVGVPHLPSPFAFAIFRPLLLLFLLSITIGNIVPAATAATATATTESTTTAKAAGQHSKFTCTVPVCSGPLAGVYCMGPVTDAAWRLGLYWTCPGEKKLRHDVATVLANFQK